MKKCKTICVIVHRQWDRRQCFKGCSTYVKILVKKDADRSKQSVLLKEIDEYVIETTSRSGIDNGIMHYIVNNILLNRKDK